MGGSLTSRTLARPSFEIAFEPPAFLEAMLAFEAALAAAHAEAGLIPAASAERIAAACRSVAFEVVAWSPRRSARQHSSCLS
jgi:3-carboxy-cis,cis-muconate cycloisomerase